MSVPARSRSGIAITETSAVFFSNVIASLVSGGRTRRSACGSTMYRIAEIQDMPRDFAARICPRSMLSIPARTISVTKAPVVIAIAVMATVIEFEQYPERRQAVIEE